MKMLNSHWILTIASALLLLLAGCGGGGGGGGGGNSGGGGSPGGGTPPVSGISGVAMDGYLSNALVFYDLNDNGLLDDGEPSTRTNAAGEYSLAVGSSELGKHRVMLVATANQTIDADSPAAPISATYTLSTTIDHPEIVSPLTTYVAATAKTSNLSSAQAEAQVKSTLAIGSSSVSLFQDFANKTAQATNPDLIKVANQAKVIRAKLQAVTAADQGPCALDLTGTAIGQWQLNIDTGKIDPKTTSSTTPISDASAADVVASGTTQVIRFQPRFTDASITLIEPCGFGAPAGVHNTANDLGIGLAISNYLQADVLRLGLFRSVSAAPYSLVSGTIDGAVVSIAANDKAEAVFSVSSPTTGNQYVYVSGSGATQLLGLQPSPPPGAMPGPMPVMPVPLNDGRFLQLIAGIGAVFSDPSFTTQVTVPGPGTSTGPGLAMTNWSGYGRDGLIYSNSLGSVPSVRFADGTFASLPCNATPDLTTTPSTDLTRPGSGRNCKIEAASGNGIVAGRFFEAAGNQGVFRFSKNTFEEIIIDAKYWGYSFGSGSNGVTTVAGVADDGSVLLNAAYSDVLLKKESCTSGPFLMRGNTVNDLKPLIPTQNCWNIGAGISGAGKVFMSSQTQGINLVMVLP